jgi:hypothetical protein
LEKVDEIKKQLIERCKPEKIILFGSLHGHDVRSKLGARRCGQTAWEHRTRFTHTSMDMTQ